MKIQNVARFITGLTVQEDFVLKNVLEDLVDLIAQLNLVRKLQFQFQKCINIFVQDVEKNLCIKEPEKRYVVYVNQSMLIFANIAALKKENVRNQIFVNIISYYQK